MSEKNSKEAVYKYKRFYIPEVLASGILFAQHGRFLMGESP